MGVREMSGRQQPAARQSQAGSGKQTASHAEQLPHVAHARHPSHFAAVPKPRVTRLVMRTLYFDDALRVALGQHHRAQAAVLRSLAQEAGQGVGCSQVGGQREARLVRQGAGCKSDGRAGGLTKLEVAGVRECDDALARWSLLQVVLLGAGMDTRAWRLPLASSAGPSDDGVSTDPRRTDGGLGPVYVVEHLKCIPSCRSGTTYPASPSAGSHVAWFEVDQADVLAVKRCVLRRLGVSFVPTPVGQNSTPRGLRALVTRAARRSIRHPLQSARFSAVAADLQVPGWSRALVAAGFNPSAATVWVLEGLLYYLQPHSVPGMIQECARVSGPGSVLVASSVSQEVRFSSFASDMRTSIPARHWLLLKAVTGAVRSQRAGLLRVQVVDNLAKRPGPRRADDIMAEFKWGLPGLPDQWPAFFLDLGWRVLGLPQWTYLAEEYGLQPWLLQPPGAQAAAPDANLLGATQQQGPPAEVEAEVQAKGVRQEVATTNMVPRLVYATCVLDNTRPLAAAAHAP
ncbi:hypothetical protein QJQ45_015520 [Haematococcus lacustris]|nr:hypothetical protein QJQ45_015520 [Haematococcus lacustris]